MFEKRIGQKLGKSASSVLVRHRNRSGVVELVGREPLMFAKLENGVTKLCRFFRRNNRKNAILGWNFPLFLAWSLVVRSESWHRRDKMSDKNGRKRRRIFWGVCDFLKVGVRIPFSVGNFHFFGRGKTNFFGEGVWLQINWLASAQWPSCGAYTRMPHPFLGTKDVRCMYWKRGGQIKNFIGAATV